MFHNIFLYPWENKLTVVWYFEDKDINETPEFFIEKSRDEGSTWTRLNPSNPVDHFLYEDDSFVSRDISDTVKYRVIVKTDSLGEQLSDPVPVVIDTENAFRVMSRVLDQESQRLRNPLVGNRGQLLKRRTAGKECTDCQDPVTGSTTDPNCSTCEGTGIVGGFYPPVEMNTVYSSIEDYRRRWRSLSGSFSSDARAVRFPAVGQWIEGDHWKDLHTNSIYTLTSQFKVISSMQGIPLVFAGLIDETDN